MATFDTNVVLRVVYEDDARQSERARRAWEDALQSGGVFLPTIVLAELAWVLKAAAKQDRASIHTVLGHLVGTAGVTVEHEDRVRRALARYQIGPADFSDYLILEAARDVHALPVISFDERFTRETEVETPALGEP